jgi:hypothetical protein
LGGGPRFRNAKTGQSQASYPEESTGNGYPTSNDVVVFVGSWNRGFLRLELAPARATDARPVLDALDLFSHGGPLMSFEELTPRHGFRNVPASRQKLELGKSGHARSNNAVPKA